ncbi:MAG: hypothetical protein Q9227_004941 [Pyrenula ochraceoflavens]
MFFLTAALTLLSASSLTLAAPAEIIPRQGTASIYFCTDVNWKGTCQNFVPPFETCLNLGAPFNNQTSAVGPAAHNYCRFFDTQGCGQTGNPNVPFFDINGPPGYADLTTVPYPSGGSWNDRIQSVHCSAN